MSVQIWSLSGASAYYKNITWICCLEEFSSIYLIYLWVLKVIESVVARVQHFTCFFTKIIKNKIQGSKNNIRLDTMSAAITLPIPLAKKIRNQTIWFCSFKYRRKHVFSVLPFLFGYGLLCFLRRFFFVQVETLFF